MADDNERGYGPVPTNLAEERERCLAEAQALAPLIIDAAIKVMRENDRPTKAVVPAAWAPTMASRRGRDPELAGVVAGVPVRFTVCGDAAYVEGEFSAMTIHPPRHLVFRGGGE
jgi:hypothetical protein